MQDCTGDRVHALDGREHLHGRSATVDLLGRLGPPWRHIGVLVEAALANDFLGLLVDVDACPRLVGAVASHGIAVVALVDRVQDRSFLLVLAGGIFGLFLDLVVERVAGLAEDRHHVARRHFVVAELVGDRALVVVDHVEVGELAGLEGQSIRSFADQFDAGSEDDHVQHDLVAAHRRSAGRVGEPCQHPACGVVEPEGGLIVVLVVLFFCSHGEPADQRVEQQSVHGRGERDGGVRSGLVEDPIASLGARLPFRDREVACRQYQVGDFLPVKLEGRASRLRFLLEQGQQFLGVSRHAGSRYMS